MKLQFADLSLDSTNQPFSNKYNDVYFSKDDGIAESEYVFLHGNKIIERWSAHDNAHFTIAESGFGTGLNVAITINEFKKFRETSPHHRLEHLHIISFELHPISPNNFQEISNNWPEFEQFYNDIITSYPPNLAGNYRIHLCGGLVTLDLVFGDITDTISSLNKPKNGIDAWYLDGFAPSKNRAMWHDSVFEHIQRLSHVGATIATFTSAGFVKRGLQNNGFNIVKIAGYGRKREMITGTLMQERSSAKTPYFYRSSAANPKHCTVVGGGIAGLSTSLALLKKGIDVNLICKNDIGDGASGNHVAGFYPQLQAEYNLSSQFYWTCFYYAYQFYRNLNNNFAFDHRFNGALLLAFNQKQAERYQKMTLRNLWPIEFANVVDQKQATEIAGIQMPHSGLFINHAGWLSPISLINALLQACVNFERFTLSKDTELTSFKDLDDCVSLTLSTGNDGDKTSQLNTETNALVIATGADTGTFLNGFDLRLTRGQVEFVPSDKEMQDLETLICHKGYFTPNYAGFHAVGSTYAKNDVKTDVRRGDTLENIETHLNAMPDGFWKRFLDSARQADGAFSRASIRCSTPDHLPIVGNIPNIDAQANAYASLKIGKPSNAYPANRNNCFVIGGLGSRGFTTSPLCAELLASQIAGRPLPMNQTLLNSLNPNRYLIRSLKRGE